MQTLRNNPVLAIALLVVAVVALAISFYFAFVRRLPHSLPFHKTRPTHLQPSPKIPNLRADMLFSKEVFLCKDTSTIRDSH
jgi:hypothetical protein